MGGGGVARAIHHCFFKAKKSAIFKRDCCHSNGSDVIFAKIWYSSGSIFYNSDRHTICFSISIPLFKNSALSRKFSSCQKTVGSHLKDMDINLCRTHQWDNETTASNWSSLPTVLAIWFVLAEKIEVKIRTKYRKWLNLHFLYYNFLTGMVFP